MLDSDDERKRNGVSSLEVARFLDARSGSTIIDDDKL
jgi:hypothetical protein